MNQLDILKNKLIAEGLREDNIDEILEPVRREFNKRVCGLVWESQPEDYLTELKNNLPILEQKNGIYNGEDCLNHILIEGDNLFSLASLQYTHINEMQEGMVDIIYIDPPYNTGNKDFKYNDIFVNPEDNYRHSKWLSFMNKRLYLAKNLLKNDGVIFISIDENEYSQLKLLCDQIFGEENQLTTFHIQVRYGDKDINEGKAFKPLMEYILAYSKNRNIFIPNQPYEDYSLDKFVYEIKELSTGEIFEVNGQAVTVFKKGEWKIEKMKKGDLRLLKETWITGSLYTTMSYGKVYKKVVEPRIEIDGLSCLYKVHGRGDDGLGYRYYTGPQKKTATKGKMFSGVPLDRVSDISNGQKSIQYRPIVNLYDYSADFGNIRLEGGVPFGNGKKPIKMIKDLINLHPNKDAIVLDFFAGSGSTGHAVLDLNKQDGGNRSFILCTNNEVDFNTEVECLINNNYISKEPSKKAKGEHKRWEKEIDNIYNSYKYKKIIEAEDFQKLGICRNITMKRLDNIMNAESTALKESSKYINNNLLYYKVDITCKEEPIKELTIQKTINRFIPYVSIKENCYKRIEDSNNYSIFINANKVVLIYKKPFVCEEDVIQKTMEKILTYNGNEKIVYSAIETPITITNVRFTPYPKDIIDQIHKARMEADL